MKKMLLFGPLVLALLSATSVKAQDERGIFVEGVASYASTHYKNYAVLTPAVGYQFNDRWAAGFKVGFDTGDLAYVTYTPFARFSFLTGSAFRMFVEGKLNFASSDVDGGQCTYQEAGFSLGASYAVCPHLRLMAQLAGKARGLRLGCQCAPLPVGIAVPLLTDLAHACPLS